MIKQMFVNAATVAALAIALPVAAQPAAGTTAPGAYSGPSPHGDTSAERAAPSHSPHHPYYVRRHAAPQARESAADQLNREEFSRLEATSQTPVHRMPAGGRAVSGGTSR